MALISCPECNKRVSEKAPRCPHCGYPIATGEQTPKPSGGKGSPIATATGTQKRKPSGGKGGWWSFIACCLVLAGAIGTVMKGCSEIMKINKDTNEFKVDTNELKKVIDQEQKRQQEKRQQEGK